MKLTLLLVAFLLVSTGSAFAESVTISKTLVNVGPCEKGALVGPALKIDLTYKTKESNLKYEKADGVSSYMVHMIEPAAIADVESPSDSQIVEHLYFGASASGSSALTECNNVRETLLEQIH